MTIKDMPKRNDSLFGGLINRFDSLVRQEQSEAERLVRPYSVLLQTYRFGGFEVRDEHTSGMQPAGGPAKRVLFAAQHLCRFDADRDKLPGH